MNRPSQDVGASPHLEHTLHAVATKKEVLLPTALRAFFFSIWPSSAYLAVGPSFVPSPCISFAAFVSFATTTIILASWAAPSICCTFFAFRRPSAYYFLPCISCPPGLPATLKLWTGLVALLSLISAANPSTSPPSSMRLVQQVKQSIINTIHIDITEWGTYSIN